MKPTLLTRSQIDATYWDAHIASSRQSVIYGLSWYLDVVCDDWNALVWPSAKDFQIVMPIPLKYKLGFPVVYQPYFCQYLGIFSQNELGANEARAFISAFLAKFSYISSYNFNPHNIETIQPVLSSISPLIHQMHRTVWLSLENAQDDFHFTYSQDRQKNLRKSKGQNWTLSTSQNLESLITLFKENHSTAIDGGVSEKSYRILRKLFDTARTRKCAELWYAVRKGEIHAGALIFKMGNTALYIFNAANAMGREGNARTFLLHHYFGKNAGGNQIFDFESPQVDSIHSFYKSFGGKEIAFLSISKSDLSFPLQQFQIIRRGFIRATRALYVILYKI